MGIKLFGKNIFQVYNHHIMRLEYSNMNCTPLSSELKLRKIDLHNIKEELAPVGTTVAVANLDRLVKKNGSMCEGFILCDEHEKDVGTIWVMYKGTNDLEYRIRNIDAYIFDVFVNSSYRGKGYAGEMIRQLMEYLHTKGIDSAHLAVSTKNISAIRAYEKAGFVTVCDHKFARVLKINIPYHKL